MKGFPRKPADFSRSILATLVLGLASSLALAADYQIIDLGANVSPKDINSYGEIAGARNTDQYPNTAFRWTPLVIRYGSHKTGLLRLQTGSPHPQSCCVHAGKRQSLRVHRQHQLQRLTAHHPGSLPCRSTRPASRVSGLRFDAGAPR